VIFKVNNILKSDLLKNKQVLSILMPFCYIIDNELFVICLTLK